MPRFSVNSTPLAGAGVYTSDTMIASAADRITGGVFSDQSGTLFIEQSLDNGVNFDLSKSIAVTGGTGTFFSEEVVVPQVRLRFVNGATPQTVFRIKALFQSAGARP